MADNVLTAKITADASGFNKTLSEVEAQLKDFQNSFKKSTTTGAESFTKFTKAAESAKPPLEKVEKTSKAAATSLDKGAKSTDQAAFALTNLGRVAQDAPFGFVGIQNNLNPLLESFQRLKASTGSNSAALKALGGSLIGPAGLGFAVSAVSSLLLVFGDKLFGASEAEKALDESTKKLAQTLADDLVGLTTVVGLIQNVTTSTADRQKALKYLNEEYDGYLKNIGIEEVTLGNLKASYDALVDSMLRQAVVKGLQEQIAAEVEKSAKTLVRLYIEQEAAQQAQEKSTANYLTAEQKAAKARELGLKQAQQYYGVQKDGFIAQTQVNTALAAGTSKYGDYEERIRLVKEQLQASLAPALSLVNKFSDLGKVLTSPKEKKGDSIIDQAKEIADYLNERTIRQFPLFQIDPTATPEEKKALEEKAKAFVEEFKKSKADIAEFVRQQPIKLNIGFTLGDQFNLGDNKLKDEIAKFAPKINDQVEREIAAYTKTNPILIQFTAALKPFYEFEKKMKEAAQELGKNVKNAFQNSFEGLAAGIGAAIAGEDIGQAIFSVLGDLISQLGRALIQYGIIKAGLDKILAAGIAVPGVAAIALGAAAIAAGSIIKQTRVRGQRALGGPVTAGSPYLVGERGQEVFVPNTSGRIVPNSALGGTMTGRSAMQIAGEFRISGNDLVAVLARTNKSQRGLS